jgi:hypothetical protein
MKKKVIALVVGVLLAPAISYLVAFLRPPMPDRRTGVHVGMTRAQVLAAYPDANTTVRDGKGFDTLAVENRMPYYADGYWQLFIWYSRDDVVKSLEYRYVDRNCGLFSKHGKLKG